MFDRYDPRDDDGRSRGDSFERHRGSRVSSDRDDDGRSAFGRHVDLPRGPDRELVRDRKRSYELNGQESEALATIGAFRVVHADDLRDVFDRERDLDRRGRAFDISRSRAFSNESHSRAGTVTSSS